MKTNRTNTLLPNGSPRYVRIYDNGGETFDRFTCCYTGRYNSSAHRNGQRQLARYLFVGMSEHPFSPVGFGQHGDNEHQIDTNKHGFAPAMGRKCHLGKRIPFADLPADCQALVLKDYKEIWSL